MQTPRHAVRGRRCALTPRAHSRARARDLHGTGACRRHALLPVVCTATAGSGVGARDRRGPRNRGPRAGGQDLFERASALFALDPLAAQAGDELVLLYDKLGDPRALPFLTRAWSRSLADARRRSAKRDVKYIYAKWRLAAVRVSSHHGGLAERRVLAQHGLSAPERGIRRASQRAIAAMRTRQETRDPGR